MTQSRSGSQAARNLPGLLVRLRAERFSGAVVVSGSPGGVIHLRDGLVAAIRTPGAPTAESLLLKSGRVGEEEWAAARAGCPADADLAVTLVELGVIGAAELEVVCTAALFDAAFAMALSPPGGWELTDSERPPELVALPGVEPQPLAEEASRRVALLARLWGPPGEFARARIRRPAQEASAAEPAVPARYRDILLSANGRRTPRDIAFALGRGVFPVMLDLTRLSSRRLVEQDQPAAPLVAPRTAPSGPAPADDGHPLPRRSPGNHLPPPQAAGGTGRPGAGAAAGILRRIRNDLPAAPNGPGKNGSDGETVPGEEDSG
jgi:hypothetical protein